MLWIDTFQKETEVVWIAFKVQDVVVKHLHGSKNIHGHVVWDVKMDFTKKAHYVAGGDCTYPPKKP